MDSFNLLPAEITSDILTRLPAELVLDCKLVSKTWRNLIKHPSFSKLHTNRLINHPEAVNSTDSSKLTFLASTNMERLYYFEYNENHDQRPITRKMINLTPPFSCDTLVESFNGLVCLKDQKEIFCIYNPMTKEYVILPEPKINFGKYEDRLFGFGYLPSTNEYKVVIMYRASSFVEVMVYTLGSGNGWRNIGIYEIKYNYYVYGGHGIFANGALYWIQRDENMILVFDLAVENFREQISLPPLPPCCRALYFGDIGGFFFCALTCHGRYTSKYVCSELWLYKENNNYDKKEQDEHRPLAWSQEFIAICDAPLAFTKSGGVLSYGSSCLSVYDRKTFTAKKLVDFEEQFRLICAHKNSLVSLKDLGEESTMIMQSFKPEMRKVLNSVRAN